MWVSPRTEQRSPARLLCLPDVGTLEKLREGEGEGAHLYVVEVRFASQRWLSIAQPLGLPVEHAAVRDARVRREAPHRPPHPRVLESAQATSSHQPQSKQAADPSTNCRGLVDV